LAARLRRLVLWEYCLSPHRAPLHRALAGHAGVDVTVVAQEDVPEDCRKLGWQQPDYGDCRVIVAPGRPVWQRLLGTAVEDVLHIFSPARAFPLVWQAYQEALVRGHRVGLLSEAHDWRGAAGAVRRLRGLADRVRFGASVSFVLAIGHLGVRWYRMCGYDPARIFPFAYFVDPPDVMAATDGRSGGELRIVFIGQLVPRKGVDLLLRALGGLLDRGWSLDIFGGGEEEPALRTLADGVGIGGRVRFRGVVGNREVRGKLPGYDLLVLPSRWEGWGAVVNEALMAGVPVVCSSACGGADLVSEDRGAVFATGSVRALRQALEERLTMGPVETRERITLNQWSRNIEGEMAAKYLLDVVDATVGDGPKPHAPWLPTAPAGYGEPAHRLP
jgi:glycosyltransferase involved in cell wall biosynthesis